MHGWLTKTPRETFMFTAITIFRIVLIIFLTVAALDSAIAETGGSPESSSGNGVCVWR